MDTIVVTGGAGFIGSNFVRHLIAHTDARVVVFDKLTYAGHLESLADLTGQSRYAFVKGDICDRKAVADVFSEQQPTWFVNFAAESHVDRSIDDPGAFVSTNVMGVYELLEASRRYWAGATGERKDRFRFLQASTDEVYGSADDGSAFVETSVYAPNSPYSASKAGADHLTRAYFSTYGLPTLITNCSNNYGPYQHPEKLIPLVMLNALEGRKLPIYGDGKNVRDWVFVEDHCSGILLALQKGRPGERYHVGGRNERTNIEIVDCLCKILESRRPAKDNPALKEKGVGAYAELKTFVKDRPGHDRRYAINADKARAELGWAPQHDFDSGMARTVDWYLGNRAWCAAVTEKGEDRQRRGLAAAK